jgi:hypothetical protein
MVQPLQRITSVRTKGAAGLRISYANAPGFLPAPISRLVSLNENSRTTPKRFALRGGSPLEALVELY